MADYISREAAIERFRNYAQEAQDFFDEEGGEAGIEYETFLGVVDELASIPAADVEPVVHGMWVSWEEADNFIPSAHRHECSVCHDAAQVLENNIELLSDFCPNCGAKMDLI